MKKTLLITILILVLLVSCNTQPEMTDDQMTTRVAQILTEEYIEPTQTEMPPLEVIVSTEEVEAAEETPEGVLVISPTCPD